MTDDWEDLLENFLIDLHIYETSLNIRKVSLFAFFNRKFNPSTACAIYCNRLQGVTVCLYKNSISQRKERNLLDKVTRLVVKKHA